MRILQVNPIEVESFTRHCAHINKDSILVGKCYDHVYYASDLTFQSLLINPKESIIKATLKMFCKKVDGTYQHTNICINNENVSTIVSGTGQFEWDVTEIVRCGREDSLRLYVYTKDRVNCCSVKEFETFEYHTRPQLEIFLEEAPPNPQHSLVNIVEDVMATNQIKYTDWIDCLSLNQYYYFIKNSGSSQIQVWVEISPDQNLVVKDTEPFIINANQVFYREPIRNSRFVRLSYQNVLSPSPHPIQVWFQGKG